MSESWFYTVWMIGIYLLGSVSFGDLVGRLSGVDIRSVGSGNPGTANIYREIGPKSAATVFLFDLAKGAAATVPIYLFDLSVQVALLAAGAVLLGHFFPIFWRFKGGTGMMVGIGATIGFLPVGAVLAMPFAVAFAVRTKDMARSGVVFFAITIVGGGLYYQAPFEALAVLLIILVVGIKSWTQYDHWRQST